MAEYSGAVRTVNRDVGNLGNCESAGQRPDRALQQSLPRPNSTIEWIQWSGRVTWLPLEDHRNRQGHSMTHLRLALTIVCLLVMSTGCRMCASKFDYCGPTVMGGCGEECGLCAPRAGSALTGASQVAYEDDTVIETAPTISGELSRDDFKAPIMPRQTIEGEEIEGIIISIEDGKPEQASEPQNLSVSSAKPSPSDSTGWSVKQ